MGKKWGLILIAAAAFDLVAASPCFAARKDFKGLFGSYRREKFTENEAHSSDFGIDFMLSTLIPVSPIVSSTEDRNVGLAPMSTSTFFNIEASAFLTLAYHWELFASAGWYNYETRKVNTMDGSTAALPRFHQFEMEAYPLIMGIKYRLSTDDIVPYVGIGAGVAFTRRKGFYDYSTVNSDQEYATVLAGEVTAGLEFFFASRAGIRLETSAYYFNLTTRTYDPTGPSGTAANFPIISYQGNPWLVRYASGIFVLF